MASSDDMILYSYWRSSCSWRVRTVLALKGLLKGTAIRPVTLIGGEQHGDVYGKVNPMNQVPALLLNNGSMTLTQSVAIMEYLEDVHPEPALRPADPLARAQMREIVEVIASGIQPLQNLAVLKKLPEAERQEWASGVILKGFQALETLLAKSAGKYCVGDEVSLADACLVPQVFNSQRYKVDLAPFPLISAINARLLEHPAFIEASPALQADNPDKKTDAA